MQILDARRCIIKTPAVLAYLHRLVLAEPAITSHVSDIQLDPQPWGQSALHFAGRHTRTGEQVLLKVNVAADQLWWTHALAHAHPQLLPRAMQPRALEVVGQQPPPERRFHEPA